MTKVNKSLYFLILFISAVILITQTALAQINGADPLLGNYNIGNSSELIMIWPETDGDQCNQKIYDFLGATNIVLPKPLQTTSGESGIAGSNSMSVTTGDYDGNGSDNLIAAWEGANRSIIVAVPEINAGTLDWSESQVTQSPDNTLHEYPPRTIRLVTGDFDADAQKEVIMAYYAAAGTIKIALYDDVGVSEFEPEAEISNESIDWGDLGEESSLFDIAVGNFDADCFDELVLVGVEPVLPTHWTIFARIYDINPDTYAIIPKARYNSIYDPTDNGLGNYIIRRLAVAAGDLDNDYFEDIAVSFQIWETDSKASFVYIQPFQINPDLNTIILNKSLLTLQKEYPAGTNNYGYPMDLLVEDLNHDGRADIISAAMKMAGIFISDDDLNLYQADSIGLANQYWDNSRQFMVLDDLDASPSDSIWYPEIIIAENRLVVSDNQYRIRVFEPILDHENENYIDSVHLRSVWEYNFPENNPRRMVIASGDFDGDGIRLGTPQRYRKTEILQPTVILNAPPIHFDVLADDICDINGCFNGGICGFESVYNTEFTEGKEVVTEVHSDWGVDASLSIGGSYMGVSAKAKLSAMYGEDFSKIEAASQTVSSGISISAAYDDRIYATTSTYDLWEYPLYSQGVLEGYLLVVDPAVTKNEWFASKSWTADAYVPIHEVGNILSYPDYTEIEENEDIAALLKEQNEAFGIDVNSSNSWWLRMEDFATIDSLEAWDVGVEIGASVGGYGIEFEVNGHYNYGEISTHRSTVHSALSLEVYMASLQEAFNEAGYSVTPYAYWAKNGALVIDYTTDVAISAPGEPETWWQIEYGDHPDPSFILPWKFDPEKGFPLGDETKRLKTNSISFEPEEPDPGDIVTITARIHNFSLLPTDNPVHARFYLGDPSQEGIPLVGTLGETEVTTPNVIGSREFQTLSMDWAIPLDIENFPKIYAVIDPDDDVEEIHENNNTGYRVLMVSGGTTDVADEESVTLPSGFRLGNAYPNPFNPATTIKYYLPVRSEIEISVYNILGRKVKTLFEGSKSNGVHSVVWDGADDSNKPVSTGVYFYQLGTGDIRISKKMILLK